MSCFSRTKKKRIELKLVGHKKNWQQQKQGEKKRGVRVGDCVEEGWGCEVV